MSDAPNSRTTSTIQSMAEIVHQNCHRLTWSQVRSILKHGAEPTKNAMNTAMATDNERTDSHITCSICLEPYHSVNIEGQIEKPALAACGHIFGDICIERWLAQPMHNVESTCPVCRFPLQFKTCHHAIAAVDPYDITHVPPPALKSDRSNMPVSCSDCSIRDLPIKRKYEIMMTRKTDIVHALAAVNRSQNQLLHTMSAHISQRPVDDTAIYKQLLEIASKNKAVFTKALQDVEKALLGSEDKVGQEMDLFLASLNETSAWHVKINSGKWAVPEGERAVVDGWGDDQDEEDDQSGFDDDEDGDEEDEEEEVDRDDVYRGGLASVADSVDPMSRTSDSENTLIAFGPSSRRNLSEA